MRSPALFTLLLLASALTCAAQSAQQPPLPVEHVTLKAEALIWDLRLTGTIEAQDSIVLAFPTGGRVVEIMARAGDRVTAGQPLARIEAVQQEQALARAEAGVAAAEAGVRQARQAADRAAEMLRRGVGTRAARDAAQQAASAADGQLRSAQTTAEQARRATDDTVLKAPQDAVVTRRTAEPGQVVGSAQPILSLAAATGLEAVFQVPDDPGLDRAMGAEVKLRPLDREDADLTGRITDISPLVDPATGSVTVRVGIDGALDPGLLGAAVIGMLRIPHERGGVSVPWTALTASGDGPAVWKIDNGTVSIAPVTVARYDDLRVIVGGGLAPGDVGVGKGAQLMYPGRPVAPGAVRQ